ncbi:hypothetical protein IGB42_01927 [Andreprevotia sp. IGB-42]|uniref:hypothetical protein n=1 Tax=Andreprevotia sp. IGB-42 TaxID=2497473 RepID=UPI00135A091B|nr:hypothetical protein [Andreprevotia sp. IGB-42]KAF0813576.1 hypothetical protein IGB42_01927 [Andreprevotia sp. IGB-42]
MINGFIVIDTPPKPPGWIDAPAEYAWIEVGAFMDRFGSAALGLICSDDRQVQGMLGLIMPRRYIDLKRRDLPAMLDLLAAKGLLGEMDQSVILDPQTTEAERYIRGLPQPVPD